MFNTFVVKSGLFYSCKPEIGLVSVYITHWAPVIVRLQYWKYVFTRSPKGIPIPPRWVVNQKWFAIQMWYQSCLWQTIEEVSKLNDCVDQRMFRHLYLGLSMH